MKWRTKPPDRGGYWWNRQRGERGGWRKATIEHIVIEHGKIRAMIACAVMDWSETATKYDEQWAGPIKEPRA